MALTIVTYLWGEKYGPEYVARLAAGVRRNLKTDYRLVVVCDHPDLRPMLRDLPGVHAVWEIPSQDISLTCIPGCFARLRLFDPTWQAVHGMARGDRIVSLDLDAIVTGDLDPLFAREEPFVILQGANAANPCPFNGSIFMLRGGAHPEVWTSFSLDAAWKIPSFQFADDQGWFWHTLPGAAGWRVGPESGVYAFHKPGWPRGQSLPVGARLVAFPGWRDPAHFARLAWVQQHWNVAC